MIVKYMLLPVIFQMLQLNHLDLWNPRTSERILSHWPGKLPKMMEAVQSLVTLLKRERTGKENGHL